MNSFIYHKTQNKRPVSIIPPLSTPWPKVCCVLRLFGLVSVGFALPLSLYLGIAPVCVRAAFALVSSFVSRAWNARNIGDSETKPPVQLFVAVFLDRSRSSTAVFVAKVLLSDVWRNRAGWRRSHLLHPPGWCDTNVLLAKRQGQDHLMLGYLVNDARSSEVSCIILFSL